MLEKAGFQFEGRLRSSVVKEGVVLDQLMYSFLRSDLEKKKETKTKQKQGDDKSDDKTKEATASASS